MTTCQQCSAPTNLLRAGARFCSTRCRMRAHRARQRRSESLPQVMRTSARWVRHTGTKRPITVEGWPASVTDPSTWNTFERASDSTDGAGLGWVLGEGIGCIDIDQCIDAAGRLAPWAQSIVDDHRDEALLVEVSRSGAGVHIFLPMEPGRGRLEDHQGRRVEVYPPNSGRYIAVTGDRLE